MSTAEFRGGLLAVALAVAAPAAVGGCVGGGVSDEELAQSQSPIAVLYWDRQASRDRTEAVEAQRGGDRRNRPGVASVDALSRLFGGDGEDAAALSLRFPGHLSLVDPGTGAIRRIEAAPPGAAPLAWSPDRSRLLLVAARQPGDFQLFEYYLAGKELRPVTTGPPSHLRGSYGPGGRLVVVADLGQGRNRVSLAPAAGEPSRTVFEGPVVEDVRWSPRGDMLLLAVIDPARRARGGSGARMLFALSINAPAQFWPPGEGSQLEPLGRGRDPVFSADGEWVFYSAPVGDGWRLRRIRTEGGGRLAVGRGVRDELEPAVSPDGRLVAYVSEDGGYQRLFVRRVDGSGDRLLLRDGVVVRPTW